MRSIALLTLLLGSSFSTGALTTEALAQSSPRLIEPARFGQVREVLGAARLVALPQTNCPAAMSVSGSKACWQATVTYMKAQDITKATVVGLDFAPTAGGAFFWGDMGLYSVSLEGAQPHFERLNLPTSDVKVPRYCYALNGEAVTYVFEKRGKVDVAQERQVVVCDGGPQTPSGPYRPEGPTIPAVVPDINSAPLISEPTYRATGEVIAEGGIRYLAYPDPNCDKANIVRETLCAAYPIAKLSASPDKEADMIGAKRAVAEGDALFDGDVDQLVLKKKSKGFKADKRWFEKTYLTEEAGCRAVEGRFYRVKTSDNALWVAEQARNKCGAPPAPTPTEIFEAYGRDMFILYCNEDRHHRYERKKGQDGQEGGFDACFDQARDYLHRNHQSSERFLVLNDRARVDDRLFEGGYISYDVAEVSLNREGRMDVRRLNDYAPSEVYMNRCSAVSGGNADSKGFIIVRSMGIQWARPYQYMACPIW